MDDEDRVNRPRRDPVDLPEGVTLTTRPTGLELTIVAPDADELIWRLHDLVAQIQDGAFQDYLDRTAR
ncbi:MAG: hypothetical protein JXQ73_09100 [Phycisphaerae bacterium]|nr:hypothetical protein [Phycisphaerae bacterium]